SVYENPNTGFTNIRRYDFPYQLGSFNKSLLRAIVVAQGAVASNPDDPHANNEFYRHTFNYNIVLRNQTTGHVGFDPPAPWPGAGSGLGMSEGESDSVNGKLAGGGSFAGCDFFHTVVGGSTSISVPIPLPSNLADKNNNRDIANRQLIDVNG